MKDLEYLAGEIYDAVIEKKSFFHYHNLVIIGENSAGKTTLIKFILKIIEQKKAADFYYIDPKNRSLVDQYVTSIEYSLFNPLDIILIRKRRGIFTNKDVFSQEYSGGTATYSELYNHLEDYQDLIERFTGLKITKEIINPSPLTSAMVGRRCLLHVNDGYLIDELSNSETSKIRILMEVAFAVKSKCKIVFIDEFDEHFSNESMIQFMNLLVNEFPMIRFVFVIHDIEPLVNIHDMDGMYIKSTEEWRFVDCNNITQAEDTQKILAKFWGNKKETEKLLSLLMSNYIHNGTLSDDEFSRLSDLSRVSLTNKERIVYDFLLNRMKQNEN